MQKHTKKCHDCYCWFVARLLLASQPANSSNFHPADSSLKLLSSRSCPFDYPTCSCTKIEIMNNFQHAVVQKSQLWTISPVVLVVAFGVFFLQGHVCSRGSKNVANANGTEVRLINVSSASVNNASMTWDFQGIPADLFQIVILPIAITGPEAKQPQRLFRASL